MYFGKSKYIEKKECGMIFTVVNQKGGVGKTTTAVHGAAGLARRGYKTLLVDLDAQGNTADTLGIEAGNDLYPWLIGNKKVSAIGVEARENLMVIRSDKETAKIKTILAGEPFREMILINHLHKYQLDYEVVVLDCPPSVDVLHTAALMAADRVIIPTKLEQLSSKGVSEMMRAMATLRQQPTCRCELAGIIPTFYDKVTSESHIQLLNLTKAFNGKVWPVIPQDTQVREASRAGQTLFEFAPRSRAGEAYDQVVDRMEVIFRDGKKRR
jgi:chromosome partitioning protein